MSLNESLLPLAGAICIASSVLEGWFLALILYVKWEPVKKLFPGVRDLVHSHVDYAMMGAVLFGIYAVLKVMHVDLHPVVILALAAGAIYNPFGFLVKAVKPEMGKADTAIQKIGILLGFIPATYGFLAFCIALVQHLLSSH